MHRQQKEVGGQSCREAVPGDGGAGLLASLDEGGPGCDVISKKRSRHSINSASRRVLTLNRNLLPIWQQSASMQQANWRRKQGGGRTDCELDLGRSLSCR